MQPLPTSSHSSTFSPPLLMVKDFSMSIAGAVNRVSNGYMTDWYLQSPNSKKIRISKAKLAAKFEYLPLSMTAIFFPCCSFKM
jgi:hypothetical protein